MGRIKHKITHRLLICIASLFLTSTVYAQDPVIKGVVLDLQSSEVMQSVTITNLRTTKEAESGKDGSFQIEARMNDQLEFKVPGYLTDTAFLYKEGVQRIYLLRDEATITINEVVISRFTDSRLDYEIEKAKREGQSVEVGKERGGIRFSLSRIFGSEGKIARRSLHLLQEEKDNRLIDKRFNNVLISSLTPLSIEEMALFRERYRPSAKFIKEASDEALRLYIMDAYKKFKEEE